jgi:hypothetical protein
MTTLPQAYESGWRARENARPVTDRPTFALGELGRALRESWTRGWEECDAELRRSRGQ